MFKPDQFLSEIYRVLKPNETLLLTEHFVSDEQEQPDDYGRNSTFSYRNLFEKNDFSVECHVKVEADALIRFQLVNAYSHKLIYRWSNYPRFLFAVFVIGFINIFVLLAELVLPKNENFSLDQVIFAKRSSR